jgi:hypothetical protein
MSDILELQRTIRLRSDSNEHLLGRNNYELFFLSLLVLVLYREDINRTDRRGTSKPLSIAYDLLLFAPSSLTDEPYCRAAIVVPSRVICPSKPDIKTSLIET